MSPRVDDLGITDLSMLIYTYVIFVGVCQVLNIFGIVTNIINIVCFVRQGFEDSANISLLGLAVADLGSLATMALLCIFLTPALMEADIFIEPNEVGYLSAAMTHFSITRVSSCIMATIALERTLCIIAPLKIKSLITSRRATVITISVSIVFFFTSIPVYVVNKLDMKFYTGRNQSRVGLVSTPDRERVEMISFAINNFTIPFTAFVIIVVCTAIISINLRVRTKWRQKTVTNTQADKVTKRNKTAEKMIVMISVLFICSFIPVNINMLAIAFIPDLSVNGKYLNVSIIICGLGYVMENINSSMNICIYYRMSSNYRKTFRKLFLNN